MNVSINVLVGFQEINDVAFFQLFQFALDVPYESFYDLVPDYVNLLRIAEDL